MYKKNKTKQNKKKNSSINNAAHCWVIIYERMKPRLFITNDIQSLAVNFTASLYLVKAQTVYYKPGTCLHTHCVHLVEPSLGHAATQHLNIDITDSMFPLYTCHSAILLSNTTSKNSNIMITNAPPNAYVLKWLLLN